MEKRQIAVVLLVVAIALSVVSIVTVANADFYPQINQHVTNNVKIIGQSGSGGKIELSVLPTPGESP